MTQSAAPRQVLMLAYPQCQVLDVAGPMEAFAMADAWAGGGAYRLRLVSPGGGLVATSGPLRLAADAAMADVSGADLAGLDTFIVAGGQGSLAAKRDPRVIDFVRRAAAAARRVASVCTGAFLLAEAGLLDGRRATTHWFDAASLARSYPAVAVDADAVFVRDGSVWTSAGITAGIDLALALIEDDLGRAAALAVARRLVVYMMRPGGQSQFSAQLRMQAPASRRLRELVDWMVSHPDGDLSVAALAGRCGLGERTFLRRFAAETGATPAKYVEHLRFEAARQALETSTAGHDRIARACGFRSAEVMRRVFQRRLGISPSDYRSRFQSAIRATATGGTEP
ncbi:MAG: DJ-1/PfpI family protein [Hyphomicrobiales bacterium]|nr:DJ-1/PfpI family protein [Hyphomicrobiales bacterium]MCP5372783.1 DJ-1/PfpI family protein [Hyphomicrobiales bacterium]